MRTTLKALLATVALMLAACTPSLEPLFTDKEAIFDRSLLGLWSDEEGNTITCTAAKDNAYQVTHAEKDGDVSRFHAHLVSLGKFRFLDLHPHEPSVGSGFYKGHLIRAHTFGRIWTSGDSLKIAMLNPDWLRQALDAGKIAVSHRILDGELILTGSTSELQAFVLRIAENAGAFADPVEWQKQR